MEQDAGEGGAIDERGLSTAAGVEAVPAGEGGDGRGTVGNDVDGAGGIPGRNLQAQARRDRMAKATGGSEGLFLLISLERVVTVFCGIGRALNG